MDLATIYARNPQWAAIFAAACLWSMSELVGSNIIPRLRGTTVQKSKSDHWSRWLIGLGMYVSIAIAVGLSIEGIMPLPEQFLYIGLAFMLVGIVLRQWAIWTLGKHFSTYVRIIKGHKIVKEGPYALVRHPSYSGALLIMLGLGLAMRTWGGTLLILFFFALAYGYRMRVEENAMEAEFGKEYIDYKKRTWKLFPGF